MPIDEKTRLLFASYLEGFKIESGIAGWNEAIDTVTHELHTDPDEFNYRIREIEEAALAKK